MVNPNDYGEVADNLKFLAENEAKRNELAKLGFDNVQRFSWESRTEAYVKALFH